MERCRAWERQFQPVTTCYHSYFQYASRHSQVSWFRLAKAILILVHICEETTGWNGFGGNANAQMFWDKCLYDGVYEIGSPWLWFGSGNVQWRCKIKPLLQSVQHTKRTTRFWIGIVWRLRDWDWRYGQQPDYCMNFPINHKSGLGSSANHVVGRC